MLHEDRETFEERRNAQTDDDRDDDLDVGVDVRARFGKIHRGCTA
jgi:hypothetical protein